MGWRGFKGHFTEVCEPDRPHVIVHVATTAATLSDVETVTARHADLAAADLLPDRELVDAAYVSVDHILDAAAVHGVDLFGPVPAGHQWQTRDPDAYDLTHFTVDFGQRHVTCPTGATSRNWRESISADGLPTIQVTFRLPDCTPCPQRARCTRSTVNARSLTFRPRPQFEAQQRLRAEQSTDAWRKQYALRSGIEGTMSQASRRCDIHHARSRGLPKPTCNTYSPRWPSTSSASTHGSPEPHSAAAGPHASTPSASHSHHREKTSRVTPGVTSLCTTTPARRLTHSTRW